MYASLMNKLNYRLVIYLGTFFTGATALVFQVVWQKYLALLVGGESRSVSLIIACFLFGLATGYHFWGKLTRKNFSRSHFLKIYGCIEGGIGLYAIIFPYYFRLIQGFSYSAGPNLAIDIVSSFLLLFPPTFLMGATIPLLTALVPDKMSEVNTCHSKIYGINNLGAFIGTILGGFFLIPSFGLSTSLMICGLVNIVIGSTFLFNRLSGRIFEREEIPSASQSFGPKSLTFFVFINGAVLICLEVLFVRFLGLSMGTGHFTYPIIVGIFILGLAIGSLSISSRPTTERSFLIQLTASIVSLLIIYFTVPYWPYWISHIRVSLISIPSNYSVYLIAVFILMSLILVPFLITAGRLLPLAYSLINKKRDDYGKVCGRLYFFNTLGTVVGAIVLAHVLVYFVNLETVFKINLGLMLVLLAMLMFMLKKIRWVITIIAGLVLFVTISPEWNRSSHHAGLFRYRGVEDYHFRGLFNIPTEPGRVLFFKDDPNSTVSVIESESMGNISRSIIVNGKSDGNTFSSDYSTMLLLGTLAYLHAPSNENLQAAVIGFGTGITAGIIGKGKDVGHISVLEISPSVIEAGAFFNEDNFQAIHNPKIDIIQDDAFRFFTREAQKSKVTLDMIVSEPSNPWVVGVENLFSLSFYKLVKKVLKPEGVFVQWLQLYEINKPIVLSVISNLVKSFSYIKLYQVSNGDLAIVGSERPISHKEFIKRFEEPTINLAHKRIKIVDPNQLILQSLYQEADMKKLVAFSDLTGTHDFETPIIGYAAGEEMFLGKVVDENKLLDDDVARLVRYNSNSYHSLERLIKVYPYDTEHCIEYGLPPAIFCNRLLQLKAAYNMVLTASDENPESELLQRYQYLREMGVYPADISFLDKIEKRIFAKSNQLSIDHQRLIALYLTQLVREGLYRKADQAISKIQSSRTLNEITLKKLVNVVTEVKIKMQKFLTP